jgi:guanylate kinase
VTQASGKVRLAQCLGCRGTDKAVTGTITDLLLKEYPQHFAKGVSHTTRGPRPGEVHGRDYFFVKNIEDMRLSIQTGEFLEHAVVHGNLYGTSFQTLKDIESTDRICLLDIDVYGLRQVIDAAGASSLNKVGILPVSMQDLESRLRGRGTESEENVQKRLYAAAEEVRSIEDDGIVDAVIRNSNSWTYGYPYVLPLLKIWRH